MGHFSYSDLDLNRNQLLNLRLENRASSFSSPLDGMLYFDSQGGSRRIRYVMEQTATPDAAKYQYIPRQDLTETISGLWTFSRSTSAPFAVISGSAKVTYLDADMLDGRHSSAVNDANTVALRDANGRLQFSDPSADLDGVPYLFMRNYVAGLVSRREACRVVATTVLAATRSSNTLTANANGSINTAGIDGITNLAVNDRVLVVAQTAGQDNGIYAISNLGSAGSPWVMQRSADCDTSAEVVNGLWTVITDGTNYKGTEWLLMTADPITLNTTVLVWFQIGASTSAIAGNGLVRVGNTYHVAQSAAYTANSLLYANATSTLAFVSNNTSGNRTFLMQVSSGVPTWDSLYVGDIPTLGITKMSMNTDRLLGRTTASTGAVEEITRNATNFTFTGQVLNTIQDIHTGAVPQFARLGLGVAADGSDPLTIGTIFAVKSTGNVSIGTTTAGARLFVVPPNGDSGDQMAGIQVARSPGGGLTQYVTLGYGAGVANITSKGASDYGLFYFNQYNGTTLRTPMIIDNYGKVGIATLTPVSALSINGGCHVGGDSDAGDNNLLVDGTGQMLRLGLGVAAHASDPLTIGTVFSISSTGDITKLKNLAYVWPSSHVHGHLHNDNSGNLTWAGLGIGDMQMSTARLLGRTTGSTGAVEEITPGTSLTFSALALNTIQDIRTTATPSFTRLGLGNSADGNHPLYVRTAASGYGIWLDGNGYFPQLKMGSGAGSGRNWGLVVDAVAWGALEFKISNAAGGDPYSAGASKLTITSDGKCTHYGGVNLDTLTASLLVATDASKNLVSVAAGTYSRRYAGTFTGTQYNASGYQNMQHSLGTEDVLVQVFRTKDEAGSADTTHQTILCDVHRGSNSNSEDTSYIHIHFGNAPNNNEEFRVLVLG